MRKYELKSNKGESIRELQSSEAESELANREAEINSLKAEIKGQRNDFKFWMEKIAASLNIIAYSVIANQISKIDDAQLVNNTPYENNRQEINLIKVVEHEIENYEAIREMFLYEFLKKSCW